MEKNILVISAGEYGGGYSASLVEALKGLMPSMTIEEISYTSKVFKEFTTLLNKGRIGCVVFAEFP
ncbi:MAG: hypothetical protein V3W26_03080, partial [Thermodesulfobacteriota bacterium]